MGRRSGRDQVRPGFGAGAAAVVVAVILAISVTSCTRSGEPERPDMGGDGLVMVTEGSEESVTPVFTPGALDSIIRPVREQIEAGAFPGAAIVIGSGAGEVHEIALGFIGWTRNASPVDPVVTMYDLASVTKVVATATGVLMLADEGKLSLDDPVSRYLPEFREPPKAAVTIRHLLTHTSGLPAGGVLLGDNRADRLARARRLSIYPPAGAHPEYSDLGYILLWEVATVAAGEPMTAYLDRKLFRPLGMTSTRFAPGLDCEECAPTGRLRDQSLYRGRPFDPLAQRLDGVTGSAGLFSTAHDLGRYMAMIVNGGELDGVRILSPSAVADFVAVQPFSGPFRLGWETFCEPDSDEGDSCIPTSIVHHTGWTGTSIHLDLRSRSWVVLLTNRTYEPKSENRLGKVRREVITRAIELSGK
ncbi:MAG: beta-lactamase family protein [Gemmatimonadota bacterium]|nr:beta-lactamase family protein [Gemmatimonadota bacterium]